MEDSIEKNSIINNFLHTKIEEFIKEREIKEEDIPLIKRLVTFNRGLVIELLHNIFNTHKEESGEELEYLTNHAEGDNRELYACMLDFYRKYDWATCYHLVRVLESTNNK